MTMVQEVGIGLRPASPQPSKRHGRDPLTFTWCKLATLAASATATTEEDDGDSDPIENVSDSSSSSGNALSPFKSTTAVATSHQSDWYRFPAPTQLDAKRATPYVDNVTRLEARLAKAGASSQGGGGGGGSTKWDFKMVGQWRVGEMLGKGTSGAYATQQTWTRTSSADGFLGLCVASCLRTGQVRLVRSIESGVFAAMKRVIHLPNDHKVRAHFSLQSRRCAEPI